MKTKLALGAVVAAIAVFSTSAFAQASAPVTREQRKAETAAANKAGTLAPAGEAATQKAADANTKTSDKTRTDRKAQTQADIKAGKTAPAGEAATQKAADANTKTSDKTREQRKAQTQADIKAGATQPAGEAANPVSTPPKK